MCTGRDCVLLKFLYVKDILSSFPPDVWKTLFEYVMNLAQAGPDKFISNISRQISG